MASSQSSLQDTFLNSVRKNRNPVTLFLVNGVKLQGVITWFDNFSVLLRREGTVQLVYKHAISTIMPSLPMSCPLVFLGFIGCPFFYYKLIQVFYKSKYIQLIK